VDTATNDPAAEIMGIMFDEHGVLYATDFIEGSPLFTIDTISGVEYHVLYRAALRGYFQRKNAEAE